MSTAMNTAPPPHILIVEDEDHLAQGLRFNLEAEGYRATVCGDGESALELLKGAGRGTVDAIVLDVMLPGCDGFAVAEALRQAEDYTPILMLTARGRPEDVLRGFAAGADDYLPKPFDLSILLARLRGLLRRLDWQRRRSAAELGSEPGAERGMETRDEPPPQPAFSFANRTIDFGGLEVRTPERTIRLTVMEADLLRYLVRHQGRIISRKELLEQVWRMHEDTDTRAIDNFIVRLRRYIEDDPAQPVHLETIRGVGYRFLPARPSDVSLGSAGAS
jgi:DNA-binding response OmpR family regulator